MPYCKECDKKLLADDKFCPYCGAEIEVVRERAVLARHSMYLKSGAFGALLGIFTLAIFLVLNSRGLLYSAPWRVGSAPIFLSMYVPSILLAAFAIFLTIRYPQTREDSGLRVRCLYAYLICYNLGYLSLPPFTVVLGVIAFFASELAIVSLPVMIATAFLVIPDRGNLAVAGLVVLLICCGWWVGLGMVLYT